MYLSRKLDDKQLIMLKQGKGFFHIGASGHEAAEIAAAKSMNPDRMSTLLFSPLDIQNGACNP